LATSSSIVVPKTLVARRVGVVATALSAHEHIKVSATCDKQISSLNTLTNVLVHSMTSMNSMNSMTVFASSTHPFVFNVVALTSPKGEARLFI
jgi:hypothetical protein